MRYNRSMRIAVFTDIYAPWATGGIVSSIQAQKRELEKLGHTVTVFCPGFDSDDPTVVTVPTFKWLKINETAVARTPQEIETAILAQRPEFGREFDLVHAHYEAACSIAGIRLARRFGLPVVQTMHGREDMAIAVNVAPALRFGVAEALDLLHAQCLEHGVEVERDQFQAPTLTRARMWRLMVNHAESADIVVTPTRHFAEKLRHYGVTRPLRVVSNGVDEDLVTQEFQVRRLEEGAPLLMLWNSRVSHEKRIMPFLKAVAQLQRPYHLTVYGDGNDLKKAQRYARQQELAVEFRGRRPRTEIIRQMGSAQLAIMASYNFDTQGMTLLEAKATGLPVFFCDPNMREVVPEGSYVLAAGPEPAAMAAALEALSAGQIEKMSRVMMAHRKEALQSTQIQKLLAVYREALAGRDRA